MESLISSFLAVLPVLALVIANGVLVAAEFSIVRSHSTRFKSPELKDRYGSKSALKLLDNVAKSISTTQLGVTVLSLVLGWYGEGVFHQLFLSLFEMFTEPVRALLSHSVAIACALASITFLHVVLGELVAKSVAIRHPEQVLRLVAGPLLFFCYISHPIVIILNGSANIVLGLFGMTTPGEADRVHSSGELAMLISHSTEQGILDKDEEEMLHGVFGFSETIAREVMTPRTDLITISQGATFSEVLKIIGQSGFSRFPVIDGTIDNVTGILLSRDLLPIAQEAATNPNFSFQIENIMREPYFIPGTKSINELLKEFKTRKLHLAIVLDEHGGVDGAVTLEDLIEEIVGDIYDESDAEKTEINVDDKGDIIVDGGVLVDDLNKQFDLPIPEGEYDTIAGFIFSSLGRIPEPGDQITISRAGIPLVTSEAGEENSDYDRTTTVSSPSNGVSEDSLTTADLEESRAFLTVEKVVGNRIETVRIRLSRTDATPAGDAAKISAEGN